MDQTLPQPPHRTVTRTGKTRGSWGIALFVLPHTLVGLGMVGAVLTRVVVLLLGANVTGMVWETSETLNKKGATYQLVWTHEGGGVTHHHQDHVTREVYLRVMAAAVNRAQGALRVPVTATALGGTAFLNGESGDPWLKTLGILLAALFWNAIVAVFQWQAVGTRLWDRWLLQHGVAVPATVTAVDAIKGGQRVRYRYRHPLLDTQVDASLTASPKVVLPRAGDSVIALVHPQRPWGSLLEVTGYRMDHAPGGGHGGATTPTAMR